MGGGGAMRAAAKVAGIGVFNTGIRAENPVTAAARKVARPVSTSVSVDDVKLVASYDDNKVDSSSSHQNPYWEIDDWEFAGVDDVFPVDPVVEKMPRVVIGGAPTLEEAKVATSELKDALEKTYLSPSANNNGLTGSFVSREGSGRESESSLSDSEYVETKPLIVSESAVATLAPKHALQAFRFLNESPAAQTVVASIASDPNVWYAVLQNEALLEYINTQKTNGAFSTVDGTMNESVGDADSPKYADESYEDFKEAGSGNGIMDYFEDIRVKVVDMMNSLSDTIVNLFGGPVGGEESKAQSNDGRGNFAEKAIGASFMGLAVMVIMVVLLKRA